MKRLLTRLLTVALLCALPACTAERPDQSDDPVNVADQVATACDVSAADREWLERSLGAWHFASRELTDLGVVDDMTMVVFDAECALTSANAMTGGTAAGARYVAAQHGGEVMLPDGETMPPVVTSFTRADDETAYFVMSLPSVWEAGEVPPGPLGLTDLMTAVLLHEGSHVAQFPTYGAQISELAEREDLPETFNDDSVQDRFGEDDAFATSVARETELFLAAASASDDAEARRLARAGRDAMRVRHARYFVGDDAYLSEAEDLWLTLEGSGQWAGYVWLVHPEGGGRTEDDAMAGFGQRSKWWTQNEGHALALAVDRLDPDWTQVAFGTADRTLTHMLDEALAKAN